ncbi:MAG: 2,3-bisphosphoglycerate-independent phosphoglycerate mutase [Calditrichaceae bacterium]|nr:2,3-bisphosphoglycerate-independent phosphoglycerate mutase [Calditrichaceae bacterium]MBN2707806.1 2,3-bisphosphoglycerate-independent phosphoglycerate mutase [Calditrichaceae bacterium]RQV96269.1 MAG: 2,3-bisphosphoglycerate-independent phosphoglycerate mutase [Calditrichota bacterium]
MKPVCLIIRDGWGYNENPRGNAVMAADTPNIDSYKAKYPWTLIKTSGEAVGLPEGFQGSSEVGHLNMGAGRVVIQELKRIDEGFKNGSILSAEKWQALVKHWKSNKSTLHFLGLLQDEGVHAHQDHLFKLMAQARKEYPEGKIIVHPFLDGRDTPPRSTLEYIAKLNIKMKETGNCSIGTIMGRYYSMDRSRNWALTDIAYNCIVKAEGRKAESAEKAVKESYANDKTPDNVDMFDEYILPYTIGNYSGIKDGDCVFHTNYRQDRAIQLSMAFVEDNYAGKRDVRPKVFYLGFTQYYDEFEDYLLGSMTAGGSMNKLLGEVISNAGLRQLRIAETQKFRHVTSFFNGKKTTPYPLEDQVEIKSDIDPAAFASYPAMEAYKVTEEILRRTENNPYSLIVINFANGDMVGHTGDFEAAKKAIEVVDECVGKVVNRMLELDAHILITSDHGNSEQMIDYETGMTKTSHTLFPVEFIYISSESGKRKLKKGGKLSDIAPTILRLLNLDIPKEMTSDVLFEE